MDRHDCKIEARKLRMLAKNAEKVVDALRGMCATSEQLHRTIVRMNREGYPSIRDIRAINISR